MLYVQASCGIPFHLRSVQRKWLPYHHTTKLDLLKKQKDMMDVCFHCVCETSEGKKLRFIGPWKIALTLRSLHVLLMLFLLFWAYSGCLPLFHISYCKLSALSKSPLGLSVYRWPCICSHGGKVQHQSPRNMLQFRNLKVLVRTSRLVPMRRSYILGFIFRFRVRCEQSYV